MKRMREEKIFHFTHPISLINPPILLLLNIRSWHKHIAHHLTDQFYLDSCSIMCFTETHVNNVSQIASIESFHSEWKDYHKATDHGLAICYNINNNILIQELEIEFELEAAACILQNTESHDKFIIFLVYRNVKTNIQHFFRQLSSQLEDFATLGLRIILVGDFNLDPWKANNDSYFATLEKNCNLHRKSEFPTHIHGGVLDMIFDTVEHGNQLEWLPTPFSDHFIIFYGL